jgi:hypothetical protein
MREGKIYDELPGKTTHLALTHADATFFQFTHDLLCVPAPQECAFTDVD